jgi:hypothetical protein
MLFDLLEEKAISKTVYKFLLRLPANKNMHQSVITIWEGSDEKGREALKKFLSEKSKFRLMYKLILLLNIVNYKQDPTDMWSIRYGARRGYEVPFLFLQEFANSPHPYKDIDLDIIDLLF